MEQSIVCRSCLTTVSLEYIDLETPLSEDTTFMDCFNYCTHLQANLGDELPNTICLSCARLMQASYDFIKASFDADQLLRNSLVFHENLDDHFKVNKIAPKVDEFVKKEENIGVQYVGVFSAADYIDDIGNKNALVKEENAEELPKFEVVVPIHEILIEENNAESPMEGGNDWGLLESDDGTEENEKETVKCYICNRMVLIESFDSHIKTHTGEFQTKSPRFFTHPKKYNYTSDDAAEPQGKSPQLRENYICHWCGEAFNSRSDIVKHRSVDHQGKLPNSCLTCGEKCPDEPSLKRHVKKEHGIQRKPVLCPYCKKTVKGIAIHIKYNHPDVWRLPMKSAPEGDTVKLYKNQCPHCLRYYQSKSILMDHINTHTGERPYSCSTCKKSFQKKTVLDRHEATAHLSFDAPKQKCSLCDFSTSNPFSFKTHVNHHSRPIEKKFLCSFCPRKFYSPKVLERHEDYKHNNGEKPFKCDVCSKGFCIKRKLKEHILCVHTKGSLHECSECGKTFKNDFQLKAHWKLHTSKQIECSQCDKKFCRNIDLRIHMRTHTGELPYACHLCEKRYPIKVRLTYHLQKHMGYKHKCDQCPNEYSSRAKLRLHMFKHIGMPYICELCSKGYPNRIGLRRHSKTVHRKILTEQDLIENRRRNEKTIVIGLVNNMDLVTGKSIVPVSANHPESELEI